MTTHTASPDRKPSQDAYAAAANLFIRIWRARQVTQRTPQGDALLESWIAERAQLLNDANALRRQGYYPTHRGAAPGGVT